MTKPLKIAPWVVPEDLQAIYDYHRLLSVAKAERILEEYDRIIALLEAGTYLLYYRELKSFWLVVGIFHARRKPSWIREQLSVRT